MSGEHRTEIMERIGKMSESDRSFDVEFWQRQGSNAIFAAAWEMVEEALRLGNFAPSSKRGRPGRIRVDLWGGGVAATPPYCPGRIRQFLANFGAALAVPIA
jgi:hypothetical protein